MSRGYFDSFYSLSVYCTVQVYRTGYFTPWLLSVLDGGEELGVRAAGRADGLECLDELVALPLVSEAGVEVGGRQTEQPTVLVRAARVIRGLSVLEVREHGLGGTILILEL